MRTDAVIGLCGYPRSGKDATAEYLAKYGFVRVSFADPLRKALYDLNPYVHIKQELILSLEHCEFLPLQLLVDKYGWDIAKSEKDVRGLLQRMGTEAGRYIHGQDCWTDIAAKKIRKLLTEQKPVVITDVRFPNEVNLVRKFPSLLIHLDRPEFGPVNNHTSERLDYPSIADGTIVNNGSLSELFEAVDSVLKDTGWL